MERLLDRIFALGPLLIPIAAVVLSITVGGAVAITKMILHHQERVARIERGMDPDAVPRS